ncbi:hypothetical protein BJ508DRAFT_419418 [Ascobolus immersus RN42]|uniref:UBX domain-containing protein n=1 Tax=Ascobolus immersus RN42 TaxID=1160509 RepID=A0A3N4HEC7_ASCIM|nr:hypothetical protein BJ508DRAFT_419418 [Ascobolus immersus RN42]
MASPETNLDALTEDQQLALQQFMSVTDQEPTTALPLLRRSEWNVQIAIAKFFDGETDHLAEATAEQERLLNNPPPAPARPAASTGPIRTSDITPAPRITDPTETRTLIRRNPLLALFLLPFSLLYKILSSSYTLFSYLFPFLRPKVRPAPKRATNPRDRAARYIRNFEETSGVRPTAPSSTSSSTPTLPWFLGGYAQAFDAAKSSAKFLLVILTSPDHEDTPPFFRDVLSHPDIARFLTENDVLLWGGSVAESEAYQVSQALEVTKLPIALLISFTPPATANSQPSTTSLSVIARIPGALPKQSFLSKLSAAVTAHTPHINAVRAHRQRQNSERELREAQSSAYEASLARDRERARLKREAEEKARREEQERLAAARKAELNALYLAKWKRKTAASLAPKVKDADKGVRVMLRIGDEKPLIRKFAEDVTLEELYQFVECREEVFRVEAGETLEDGGEGSELDEELPEGWKPEYGFRLVTNMPKTVHEASGRKVGEEWRGSAVVFVEEVGGEEEEEEEEE